jgi:hypothetical protein
MKRDVLKWDQRFEKTGQGLTEDDPKYKNLAGKSTGNIRIDKLIISIEARKAECPYYDRMKVLLHESPVTDRRAVKNSAMLSDFNLLGNRSTDEEDDVPTSFTDPDEDEGDEQPDEDEELAPKTAHPLKRKRTSTMKDLAQSDEEAVRIRSYLTLINLPLLLQNLSEAESLAPMRSGPPQKKKAAAIRGRNGPMFSAVSEIVDNVVQSRIEGKMRLDRERRDDELKLQVRLKEMELKAAREQRERDIQAEKEKQEREFEHKERMAALAGSRWGGLEESSVARPQEPPTGGHFVPPQINETFSQTDPSFTDTYPGLFDHGD